MKMFKKLFLELFFVVFLCLFLYDVEIFGFSETKILCDATIEENFSGNQIKIVLNTRESMKFKKYSVNDFSEINCTKVEDLTEQYENLIKGNRYKNHSFRRILKLTLSSNDKENVLNSIKILEKRDDIYAIEPSYISNATPLTAINDFYYLNYFDNNYKQWAIDNLNLLSAWNMISYLDTQTVRVAILDNGIDMSLNSNSFYDANDSTEWHKDFTYMNGDFETNIFGVGLDLSGNNNPLGIDTALFEYEHGTMVAGIIGAIRNNSIGVAGMCNDLYLHSIRINYADMEDLETMEDKFIKALTFAEGNDIKVINISLSIPNYSVVVEQAINNYSGLIVCGAGNDYINIDNDDCIYPACYNCDNIITVGASTINNEIWTYQLGNDIKGSNYGVNNVDIFAPGENIVSTIQDSLYDDGSGTSYAVPHVTGVAALLLSIEQCHPSGSLSTADVKNIILNSAKQFSSFSGKCSSGGRLDAFSAVSMLHDYTSSYFYDYYNSEQHRVECECGYFYYENHNWILTPNVYSNVILEIGPILTRLTCEDCLAVKVLTSNNNEYVYSCEEWRSYTNEKV